MKLVRPWTFRDLELLPGALPAREHWKLSEVSHHSKRQTRALSCCLHGGQASISFKGGSERVNLFLKVTQPRFSAQALGIQLSDARNTNGCTLHTVSTQAGPGAGAKGEGGAVHNQLGGGQNANLSGLCRWYSLRKPGTPLLMPQL